MSYEHGTPHYNLPQTVGSDTRDWFDTNEAFADIDAAIYSAGQTAETAAQDLDGVKSDVQSLKDADIAMTGRVDGIEGRVGASEQAITRLQQDVADVDTDLMDAICAIKEASATAAYQHLTGTFFWYNDTLYKATADIGVGNQIVPDTNCSTTNITTELLAGGGEVVDSTARAGVAANSAKIGDLTQLTTDDKTDLVAAINELVSKIGGGSMPNLDFANPIHTFSTSGTFTATKDCYLLGAISHSSVSINGTVVYEATITGAGGSEIYGTNIVPLTKLSAGDVVSGSGNRLHVFDVLS